MEASDELPGLDLAMALSRVGGDEELLREIAGLFLDDYPGTLSQIRRSVQERDPKALERSAHSLKGAAMNFGARSVVEAAYRLELMGRTETLEASARALAQLETALERLAAELAALATRRR